MTVRNKFYWGFRKLRMAYRNLIYSTSLPLTCNLASGQRRISKDIVVGEYGFIGTGCTIYPKVEIGNYCLIAPQVQILGFDHAMNIPGTPTCYAGRQGFEKTKIGDDVWIGTGAFIHAGITIGNGAVIGAHAFVTKDVPSYAIMSGNPARLIRVRFSAEDVEKHEMMLAKPPFRARFSGRLETDRT